MRTTTIILISFFLVKCNRVDKTSTTSPSPQTIDHKTEVDDIINSIQSDELVEGEEIGVCWAKKSDIYPKFLEINNKVNDAELVDLTKHRKPNMRAYAFWFLAKRHYKNITVIYKNLRADTSEITLRYKDEQWIYKMPDFCHFILHANQFDASTIKFDDKALHMLEIEE